MVDKSRSWTVGQIALLVVIVGAVAGLAVVVLITLGVWSISPTPGTPIISLAPSCPQQAAPFLASVQKLAGEWDDANKLASSTPRMSLPPQVSTLQGLRRRAQDLEAPECAFLVKQRLIDSMDNTINGYIAFLAQKPDSEVNKLFEQAGKSLDAFGKEIAALK